jgi:hypothetical protein
MAGSISVATVVQNHICARGLQKLVTRARSLGGITPENRVFGAENTGAIDAASISFGLVACYCAACHHEVTCAINENAATRAHGHVVSNKAIDKYRIYVVGAVYTGAAFGSVVRDFTADQQRIGRFATVDTATINKRTGSVARYGAIDDCGT